MAHIYCGTLVIKRALRLDLSCHYNSPFLISVDNIGGVYCSDHLYLIHISRD